MSKAFVDRYKERYQFVEWNDNDSPPRQRSPPAADLDRASSSSTLVEKLVKSEVELFVDVKPNLNDPASRDSSIEFEDFRPKIEPRC